MNTAQVTEVAGYQMAKPAEVALRKYGFAAAFVLAALVLTLVLRPFFPYPFFLLFFPAVMGAAWLGGMAAGLFAVVLSTITVDYFFVPPLYSLGVKATE